MNRIAALLLAAALHAPAAAVQFQTAPKGVSVQNVAAARAQTPGALVNPAAAALAKPGSVVAAAPAAVPAAKPSALENLGAVNAAAADVRSYNGATHFDGAEVNGTFHEPSEGEMDLIVEALNRGSQNSQLVSNVLAEFTDATGNMSVNFAIDYDPNASYYATSFVDQDGVRTIGIANNMLENESWAFIMSMVVRELMGYHSQFASVAASSERLAMQHAHMAMAFAQATGSDMKSWAYDHDHHYGNENSHHMLGWYQQLVEAVTSTTKGFADSEFMSWAQQVGKDYADKSYMYTLYERFSRKLYRADSPNGEKPIPNNVPTLGKRAHDVASARIYGNDGNGDNNSDRNLLGYLRNWFRARGNK